MPATPAIIPRTQPLLGPTGVGTNNQILSSDGAGGTHWVTASSGGVTDHGSLTGLGDDDHTQYPLSAGRAGGQTIVGGTGSGDKLTLRGSPSANASVVYGWGGITVGGPDNGYARVVANQGAGTQGLAIVGTATSGTASDTHGIAIGLSHNLTGNRQLAIGPTDATTSAGRRLRMVFATNYVSMDAINGLGQRANMSFGTSTSNVTFGSDTEGPSNAKAFFGGEATKATAVFRTAASQTANAIEVQSPAGARLSGVGPNGAILNAVFSDATRPAAGIAGRVIYNSDDGNLNIDTGTQWVTPDGVIT